MAEKIKSFNNDICVAAVNSALPNVSTKTLQAISDAMEVNLKYDTSGNNQRALENAVKEVGDKLRRNLQTRKYQQYKNLLARKKVESYLNQNWGSNPFEGLFAKMMGIATDRKGSRLSAAVQQTELHEYYLSGVIGDLNSKNILDKVVKGSEEFHKNISLELERIDQEGIIPSTGDKDAKLAADVFHTWQEKARLDANDAGASIGKISGYIVKQNHDMFKVRNMGKVAWKDLIRDKIDWEKVEKSQGRIIEDKEKWLDNIYQGIVTGTHMKHADSIPAYDVPASVSKSLGHERVLHFKTGEWFEYNKVAGRSQSVLEAVLTGLNRSAESTGLMRTFGPSAIHNLDKLHHDLMKQYGDDPKLVKALDNNKFESHKKQLTNESRIPGNQMIANVGSAIRTFENFKLGGATITAIMTDPMLMATELKYQGKSLWGGYAAAIKNEFKGIHGDERIAKAKALGIMFQSIAGDVQSRIDAEGNLPGTLSKINTLWFKANLLTPHTDRMRIGAAEAMGSMAASYSHLKLSDLPKDFQRLLNLFEIDERDWNTLRANGVQSIGDEKLITLEAIDAIPDDVIKKSYGDGLSEYAVRQIRNDLRSKYHSYLIDRVDTAVLKPDKRTAAMQTLGTQSGTAVGEIVRTGMQFKGFPIAFVQKVLGREIYGKAEATKMDVLMNLSSIMVQSTLLGYGVLAMKDIIAGREPRDLADIDVLREAALKGGGLGFYGDILFGEMKKEWGRSFSSSMLGPGVGTLDSFMNLVGQAREGDLKATTTLKTLYRESGVTSLFYVKPLLDYGLLYQSLETMEPGYMSKMERRMERERGVSYIVSPSEVVQK